jgi:heme/copper-type cytochrome/quinol oxidase subunit 2
MNVMRQFRSARPLAVAVLSVAAIVVLFVLLRPENNSDRSMTRTVETTSTNQTTRSGTPPARTRTRVTITVRGGGVVGGIRRVTLPQRARVELFVASDVADDVHLHGYDLSRDVAPGAPVRLRFTATTAGRFEVELEQRGLQIAEITVRP